MKSAFLQYQLDADDADRLLTKFTGLAAILLAAFVLIAPVRSDAATGIHDWNRDAVSKTRPPAKSVVTFDSDTLLTMVRVYHMAPRTAIAITLKGRSGSYRVTNFAKAGAFGSKKELQVYVANPAGIVVNAGEYEVVSSDPSTWLYNAGTGNRGFLVITGTRQPKNPGQPKVGDRLKLGNLQFIGGTATLHPASHATLNGLHATLARYSTLRVDLRGHVNKPGAKPDMKIDGDLGGRRAKSVHDFLINKGIAKGRLTYRGYGNTQPLHPKPRTPDQEAANRRVEVVVVAR